MKATKHLFSFKAVLPTVIATGIFAATLHAAPDAEPTVDPSSHAAHVAAGTPPTDAPKGDPGISKLQAKVAQLEAALAKNAPVTAAAPAGAAMPGMPAAGETPSAGPMAGTAGTGAGTTTAPAMAGMGGSGGGLDMMGMMGKMDKMMSKMDKMMGMGAMPMDEAPMAPATSGDMDMDKMKMGGMDKMKMDKMKMDKMEMDKMEMDKMEMDKMEMDKMEMDKMGMDKMGMDKMGMDKMEMAGMMGMPPMGGGAPGAMPRSALPGFPGASHLYHLGATDFFLDHEAHIALTTEQTAALNQAKEKVALAKSTADRAIAQAEQELWTLTASDQPDIVAIEAKTAEIGKLTGDARVAFIRAVGEASKILTDEQRKILTGFAPAVPVAPAAPMKGM